MFLKKIMMIMIIIAADGKRFWDARQSSARILVTRMKWLVFDYGFQGRGVAGDEAEQSQVNHPRGRCAVQSFGLFVGCQNQPAAVRSADIPPAKHRVSFRLRCDRLDRPVRLKPAPSSSLMAGNHRHCNHRSSAFVYKSAPSHKYLICINLS